MPMPTSSPTTTGRSSSSRQRVNGSSSSCFYRILTPFLIILGIIVYGIVTKEEYFERFHVEEEEPILLYKINLTGVGVDGLKKEGSVLPQVLVDMGIYKPHDFQNALGISPSYWIRTTTKSNTTTKTKSSQKTGRSSKRKKGSTSNNKHVPPPVDMESWGPCYPPEHSSKWSSSSKDKIQQWSTTKSLTTDTNTNTTVDNTDGHDHDKSSVISYQYRHSNSNNVHHTPSKQDYDNVAGGCRPGFLIIGAGKCGTSSLYHYLVGHPRVAPAYKKQIHYFKYHLQHPLGWYYSYFPTTESFLQHGTLMTGEASPGYLPYPDVVRAVHQLMPGPKIIMAGRNPLERTYSSYNYNYVQPTIELLQKGKIAGYPKGKSDDYYKENHIFTFEELIDAELKQLQKCLYGFGINATRDKWGSSRWFQSEFDRRDDLGLDPLIDLDAVCYGDAVNKTVLRPQWSELQMKYPNKVITDKALFTKQAMIGRSLYVFPLEWWYIKFPKEDIHFICTEDLSKPDIIGDLSLNLGLPEYNFTDIVSVGAYNVGTNRGYDAVTSWEQVENETSLIINNAQQEQEKEESSSVKEDDIPISPELRKQVLDFIRPFNERLFELTGKRCDWN